MLKLADPSITMPGGWHAPGNCGLTLYGSESPMFQAGTFSDLIARVTEYRIANRLPVAEVRREVEEWICRETKAKCRAVEPEAAAGPLEITVGDAWRFLKTMATWLLKRETVPAGEADRRAEICAGCRFQAEPPVDCWGCSQLFTLIHEAIGDRTTRFDGQLRFCGICKCNNKVQAWAPIEVLRAYGPVEPFRHLDTDGRGTPCWKGEE